MSENDKVFGVQPVKPDSESQSQLNIASSSPPVQRRAAGTKSVPHSSSKEFKFVNNSPNTMTKPRQRMKPTFRVDTQSLATLSTSASNEDSVIIEQTFNNKSNIANTINDTKYVFQLNVKRPPGRPRKHPVEENKIRRPQGRPRKYPIEVTGSSALNTEASKVMKPQIKATTTQSDTHGPDRLQQRNRIELADTAHEQFPIAIDTELELASRGRRSRGRPKRSEKDDDRLKAGGAAAAAAVAVAVALNEEAAK